MVNNLPAFNKSVWSYLKAIGPNLGWLLYYVALFVTSILGLTGIGKGKINTSMTVEWGDYSAAFYGIHVLHLAQGNAKLVRALQAVTNNGSELLAVMMLIISFVYVFSVFGFLFFRVDFDAEDGRYCDTLGQCFGTVLMYGMTAGAGTREVLAAGNSKGFPGDGHYIGRIVFDLLFFVAIPIISMNLILGIIVDTFSQLRDEQIAKQEEYESKCFICSLPDHIFERHDMKGPSTAAAAVLPRVLIVLRMRASWCSICFCLRFHFPFSSFSRLDGVGGVRGVLPRIADLLFVPWSLVRPFSLCGRLAF